MRTDLNCQSRMFGLPFRRPVLLLLGMSASVIVAASPVQARTRDQVMSRAFGCAGIGDARLWLDCYYGAAQPVRAALGLQPASSAQIGLAQSPPAGSAPQAEDIRESVLSGAARCDEVQDDRNWLDCYYAAAQPMRAQLNLPPARPLPQSLQHKSGYGGPQSLSIPDQSPGKTGDDFGLSSGLSRMKSVTARMTVYKFDRKGNFTVTLSNGETWRQLSGDTSFAHWKGNAEQYIVHVSRGFLGSYNLEVRANPGMYKVHRIQ